MIKRSNINLTPEVNQELDYIISQLLHKNEAALKIKIVNKTINKQDLNSISENQFMFNIKDSKLYLRINNKLYSFTGTLV